MDPIILGYIGIGVLLVAIAIRVPVAFAMILVGLIGMLFLIPTRSAIKFLAIDMYNQLGNFTFSCIPMFVLMGFLASSSGMTRKLYDVSFKWFGQYAGGLALTTVVSNALFASVTGSSPAACATVGKIAFPEMKRHNYDDALATGSIAAAGTLAPLIPPSNGMIVYGLLTEQSIGKLFIAGLFPGLLLTALFMITVYLITRRNPRLGPPGPKSTWGEKIRVLPGLLEMAFVFLLVLGGLFAGFFTPTQAGAVGAFGCLLLGLIRRSLGWKQLWTATKESLLVSCMIMVLITGALVFGHFLSLSTMPMFFSRWIDQLPVDPWVIFGVVCLFYIIGGCFVDALSLMVITIPIIFPVIFKLGFDPIWFGVIIVMLGETGVITPPVGINVYVVKNIAPEVPLMKIFSGIVPFFFAVLVAIIIVAAVPAIATFLPSFTVY
jgi:C4-dicarboxylate transporter DctM subunit